MITEEQASRCTTHHGACDCQEYAGQQRLADLERLGSDTSTAWAEQLAGQDAQMKRLKAAQAPLVAELAEKDAAGRALAKALRVVQETGFAHPCYSETDDRCLVCEALAACPPEWKEKP